MHTAIASAALPPAVKARDLTIEPHLNGPRRAANGGFAAGTIARTVDADTVTVRLHRRVSLGRRLTVRDGDTHDDAPGGAVVVTRGRTLIASARPGVLDASPAPTPPDLADAFLARDAHPLQGVRHPLSTCVVCGPERTDGMHVAPGPVPGRPHLLAAPWVVGPHVSTHGAALYPAVWAALDCPSYPAVALRDRVFCVLGTMTARVDRRPRLGEAVVVYSWTRENVGRRYETSAAMVDARGEIVARADATWIATRRQPAALLGRRRTPTSPRTRSRR